MGNNHNWRPRLEPLEDRIAPSSADTLLAPTVPALETHSSPTHVHLALAGQVSGTWTAQPPPPDGGATQVLQGSGSVLPLGTVQANGTLLLPGFVATGRTHGTMTLTNAQGSVTLQLVGRSQAGFSGPPTHFHYRIISGTGSYAGAHGHGRIALQESPPQAATPPSFTMTFLPPRT